MTGKDISQNMRTVIFVFMRLCPTQLQNGLVFVLVHLCHQVNLSDVDVLFNCRCSVGEHNSLAVSA